MAYMGAHTSCSPKLTNLVSLESSLFLYTRNIHYYSEIFKTNELACWKWSKCHAFRGRWWLLRQSSHWNSPSFSIMTSQWQHQYYVVMVVAMVSRHITSLAYVLLKLLLLLKKCWNIVGWRISFYSDVCFTYMNTCDLLLNSQSEESETNACVCGGLWFNSGDVITFLCGHVVTRSWRFLTMSWNNAVSRYGGKESTATEAEPSHLPQAWQYQ